MARIKLDLHDIFNKGQSIETELNRVIEEAIEKGISVVEIIPGINNLFTAQRVRR